MPFKPPRGTEAAVELCVVGGFGSATPAVPAHAVRFEVDRPFLFFIRHNNTGMALFLGRVAEPTIAPPEHVATHERGGLAPPPQLPTDDDDPFR